MDLFTQKLTAFLEGRERALKETKRSSQANQASSRDTAKYELDKIMYRQGLRKSSL